MSKSTLMVSMPELINRPTDFPQVVEYQLLLMESNAIQHVEKMASGDYSACRLPYFVGFTPLPPDHCEI